MDNHNNKLTNSCKKNPRLGNKHRYITFLSNGLKIAITWIKDSHNKKLSYSSEENPKLGPNHRYFKCLVIHD